MGYNSGPDRWTHILRKGVEWRVALNSSGVSHRPTTTTIGDYYFGETDDRIIVYSH